MNAGALAVARATAASAEPDTMLSGPLLPLLARLALPTVIVMFMVTVLSVAETYLVSVLGTEAIAAAAMVVPVLLLMTMVSNGGIGGGVSSAIARARGAGRPEEAESLAWHALQLGLGFGALFTLALWAGGPALYRFQGGQGPDMAGHIAVGREWQDLAGTGCTLRSPQDDFAATLSPAAKVSLLARPRIAGPGQELT